jgi:acyl-CoA thioesterase
MAERCVAAMLELDRASKSAGMAIQEVRPGYARVAMKIRSSMINGHVTAHGGWIFTLADSAFAFACNSRNVRTVAQHCSITFLTPAREGERLVAEAKELTLKGRFGIYDVVVTGSDDRIVAVFRGHSAALRDSVIPA